MRQWEWRSSMSLPSSLYLLLCNLGWIATGGACSQLSCPPYGSCKPMEACWRACCSAQLAAALLLGRICKLAICLGMTVLPTAALSATAPLLSARYRWCGDGKQICTLAHLRIALFHAFSYSSWTMSKQNEAAIPAVFQAPSPAFVAAASNAFLPFSSGFSQEEGDDVPIPWEGICGGPCGRMFGTGESLARQPGLVLTCYLNRLLWFM